MTCGRIDRRQRRAGRDDPLLRRQACSTNRLRTTPKLACQSRLRDRLVVAPQIRTSGRRDRPGHREDSAEAPPAPDGQRPPRGGAGRRHRRNRTATSPTAGEQYRPRDVARSPRYGRIRGRSPDWASWHVFRCRTWPFIPSMPASCSSSGWPWPSGGRRLPRRVLPGVLAYLVFLMFYLRRDYETVGAARLARQLGSGSESVGAASWPGRGAGSSRPCSSAARLVDPAARHCVSCPPGGAVDGAKRIGNRALAGAPWVDPTSGRWSFASGSSPCWPSALLIAGIATT